MTYTIIVHTPPDNKCSEYSAHLLEHIKLSGFQTSGDFFGLRDISGYTYTFYSTYTAGGDPQKLVDLLKQPVDISKYILEKNRIQQELETRSFYKKAIEKAGKILHNDRYTYGRSKRISKEELILYNKEYYTQGNFVIYSSECNQIRSAIQQENILKNIHTYNCVIGREQELLISVDITPENICILHLIETLWDKAIEYYSRKYYSDDTIMGEFPEKAWIMVPIDSLEYILSIDEEFVKNYIEYSVNNIHQETIDADIPSILTSGYLLGIEAKIGLIKNIGEYHKVLIKSLTSL